MGAGRAGGPPATAVASSQVHARSARIARYSGGMPGPCRPPIAVSPVLDEPGVVRELVERTAPHLPVQRYFKSGAEMRSQSGPGFMD